MRIGELARRGECEVETERFYEREGLLERPDREPNGYRRYADRHLVQLAFIRHCRSRHTTRDCGILRNLERAAEGEACTCHQPGETGQSPRGAAGRR